MRAGRFSRAALAEIVQLITSAIRGLRDDLHKRFPDLSRACGLMAGYVFAIGLLDVAVEHLLVQRGSAFLPDLTPLFRRPDIGLYAPLITYLVGCLAIIGGLAAAALFARMPNLARWLGGCLDRAWPWLLGSGVALPLLTTAHLAPLCGGVSAAAVLIWLSLRENANAPRPWTLSAGTAAALATAVTIAAMSLMATAWYPVRVGNDYIELDDRLKLPASDAASTADGGITRQPAVTCVRAGEKVGQWSGGVVLSRGGVKPCHWLG